MAFKELYAGTDAQTRDEYINCRHNSEAVPTIAQMIRGLKAKRGSVDDDSYDQNMTILLSILEPLLINDNNLEIFFKLGMAKDLSDMVQEQPLPSELQTT